jgi:hypothetical protein
MTAGFPKYFAVALANLLTVSALAENQISPSKASIPIVDVQMGTPTYFDAGGDSWDPTWSQDDDLYSAVNDGGGFGTLKRNVGFNRISGNDPLSLRASSTNHRDGISHGYWPNSSRVSAPTCKLLSRWPEIGETRSSIGTPWCPSNL